MTTLAIRKPVLPQVKDEYARLKPSPEIAFSWEIREAEKVLSKLSLSHKPLVNFFAVYGDEVIQFFGEASFYDYPKRLNWLKTNYKLFPCGYLYDFFGLEFIFISRKTPQVIIPEELSESYFKKM